MELDIKKLINLTGEMPVYRDLLDELRKLEGNTRAVVLEAAKPYLITALYHDLERPVFVVTARPEDAKRLYEQIAIWSNSARLKLFPEPDVLPYQRVTPDTATEMDRLEVLSVLASADGEQDAPLVIASIPALAQKTVSHRDFIASRHTVEAGQEVEPLSLLSKWETMGYRVENLVEVPGTISRRGGIVDIYPPSSDLPARLEFYGNTIERIRLFDPASPALTHYRVIAGNCPGFRDVGIATGQPGGA